jgi:hypothetical protein
MTPPMTEEIRQLIAARAYSIWEREGQPHGRQAEHWAMAEAELFGKQPAKTAAAPKNAAKKAAAPKPVAEKKAAPKKAEPKKPEPEKVEAKKTGVKQAAAAKTKKAAKPKTPAGKRL